MMRAALYGLATCIAAVVAAHAQQPTPAAQARALEPSRASAADVHTLHVQRNVYMLVGPRGNTTVQIGPDGPLVVDPMDEADVPRLFEAIRALSDTPIHTIVQTHVHDAHIAGTNALVKQRGAGPQPVRVMAHDQVQNRLVAAAAAAKTPLLALPVNNAYFTPTRDFSSNGEAIVLHHLPSAHTDGDTAVFFRGSDVITVGDVFTPDLYPVIDLQNGGSVQGSIDALNRILDLTVPARFQEGGTYVIPGHGRLCDEAEVVEYRDMLTIIRDRVQDSIKKGMTLEQVRAARPTRDYDGEYGATSGFWTTAMFVEAVYRSLSK